MTAKTSNQGMRQPQLGGIGSIFNVGRAAQTCKHGRGDLWRLKGGGAKWICGICHPPAVTNIERFRDDA